MKLSKVKLILSREIRDQLRDRRTLFMILVLPILLYPLLGMCFFQFGQFLQEQPSHVLVLDANKLDALPDLFENQQFAADLFNKPERANLLQLYFLSDKPNLEIPKNVDSREYASQEVQLGRYDAALYFPPDFVERLASFRQAVVERALKRGAEKHSTDLNFPLSVPSPEIIYTTAQDKSQIAYARLADTLRRWTDRIVEDNLQASGLSRHAIHPFTFEPDDLAGDGPYRGATSWAKIMPVLLILWALTGAFYPAVDLCAGEKERNTLETLLSSPAQRDEIVMGKLLAIMLFSMVTAILNLLSMGLTMWAVFAKMGLIKFPPLMSVLWLLISLAPVSALFSALCLALAAFARSTKEGQYYLMPLLLVTMPLAILPMSPGVELTLGNSLIPIAGVVLLLRTLLEGHYLPALQYFPVVAGVTVVSCFFAVRWAVEQFNSDGVLFRESERLELRLRLLHLLRNRNATPTAAAALFCAIVILLIRFFLAFSTFQPDQFGAFARMALITQLGAILAPTLLLAFMLSGSVRQTFVLKFPAWKTIPAAILLAVLLHPSINVLQSAVTQLYPVGEGAKKTLGDLQQMLMGANLWELLLVIAVTPAICEELAFRGFVLSGFRHLGHKWRAIILSAVFFGLTHGILQQSLLACLAGVILGFLAVQTGSIFPCMAFHLTHNTLAVLNSRMTPVFAKNFSWLHTIIIPAKDGGFSYSWTLVFVSALLGMLILWWFGMLTYRKTPEEILSPFVPRK